MKRILKKAVLAWAALELIGALVALSGGKALEERLFHSLRPRPVYAGPVFRAGPPAPLGDADGDSFR